LINTIFEKMQVTIAYVARPYMVGLDPEKGLEAAKSLASIFEHGVCVCVCVCVCVRGLCVFVCVCMCICMYVCMHACMYVY